MHGLKLLVVRTVGHEVERENKLWLVRLGVDPMATLDVSACHKVLSKGVGDRNWYHYE